MGISLTPMAIQPPFALAMARMSLTISQQDFLSPSSHARAFVVQFLGLESSAKDSFPVLHDRSFGGR